MFKHAVMFALVLATCSLCAEPYAAELRNSFVVNPEDAKIKALKAQNAKDGEAQYPVMVRVSGRNFEIGKYEVTQKQWQNIMGNNPSHFSSCGANCPVEMV